MLAQGMCLEVPPYVGSEVPGVTGDHGVGSALGEEVRANQILKAVGFPISSLSSLVLFYVLFP